MKILFIALSSFIICSSCHSPSTGLEIGLKAPELKYPDPKGEKTALSSLQGNIVLIDFWASWCPPCRRENPYLVEGYNQFKDQNFKSGNGFTIYSVSFDRELEAWAAAIAKDSLVWPNHVSDLKGWEAEAAYIYNINSIPSNLLIDGDGIIIAKNIKGEELITTLGELSE